MEDKDKYQKAATSIKKLSQELQTAYKNKPNGAGLLFCRELIGSAGPVSEEIERADDRLKKFQEILDERAARAEVLAKEHPELMEAKARFMKRHGLPVPHEYYNSDNATEKGKAYLQRHKMPPRAREITPRDLKLWAWEIADEKAQASGRPQFEFDRNNRYLFADMLWYFAGVDGKFDLNKGIALFGDVGVGKTILFEIFSTLLARKAPHSSRRFRIKQAREIMREYAEAGTLIIDEYKTGNLCIDDTGDEATELKVYGNAVPVIEEIFKERYERWKRGSGELTHITTNLDVDAVYEKYGERAADRLGQMMSFFSVQGHPDNGSRRIK